MIDNVTAVCPLPVVDLRAIDQPADGLWLPLSETCRRKFAKDDRCREHYEKIARSNSPGDLVQCPFGFASFLVFTESLRLALTGIVPYPRSGGENERKMAKANPQHKVSVEALRRVANSLIEFEMRFRQLEVGTIKKYSVALHEIRKLNRTVKQTAERLCREENRDDPTLAQPELVRIWKTAELMSQQFDVIEILANEELVGRLPVNSECELYRLVDKCVRIYEKSEDYPRLTLHSDFTHGPRIKVCDKTFAIIPAVLIENALRYSIRNTLITINLRQAKGGCMLTVTNNAITNPALNDSVFQRGVRASQTTEGSGNGLYVAQLVAIQHGTSIKLDVRRLSEECVACSFSVFFKTLK